MAKIDHCILLMMNIENKGINKELLVESNDSIIEAFLNSLDVKDATKKMYQKHLGNFFSYLGKQGVQNPRREDILNYKEYFISQEKKPSTINTYLVPVFLFFKFTADIGAYPNVSTGIKRVKDFARNKKSALSGFQVKRLLQHLSNQTNSDSVRNFAIINLMLRTGLRDIEIVRANIGDIGTEYGQTVLYIWGKGRSSKDNFVVLTETTYNIILDYLNTRKNVKEEDPLFTSMSTKNLGGRLTTRSISRIVKNTLCECGLNSSKLTAHSLRHTSVTAALLAGASVQSTKEMARHSNIETTMIYAHNINRVGEDAAERKVDNWIQNL